MRIVNRRLALMSAAMILTSAAFTACGTAVSDNGAGTSAEASSEGSAKADDNNEEESSEDRNVVPLAKYSDKTVDYEETAAVKIVLGDSGAEISGQGAVCENGVVTISAGGEYVISGQSADCRIIVSCPEDENVKLILDGADISCSDNAALTISSAKNAYIIIKDGTVNSLYDGTSYSDEESTDGCIFSKTDLIISSSGTLNVTGNYKHGIVSKDDLAVLDGNINVTAASSGICGKDLVEIHGGNISVTAGNDGIKSTNTEDADKGSIIIGGGNITVVSEDNCISSAASIDISGGVFDLTAGGGAENAAPKNEFGNGGGEGKDGGFFGGLFGGEKPEGDMADGGFRKKDRTNENGETDVSAMSVPEGEMPEKPEGMPEMNGEMPEMPEGIADPADSAETEESSAPKGIKADGLLTVSGGELNIDASGDGIHSNGNMTVSGGKITAFAGSQGIHADIGFLMENGDINITESFEGIEAKTITVNGGNISSVSSDDGFNGTDGTGSMKNMFDATEGVYIEINGGVTELNAGGDGIDSNGDLYIKGGEIYVSGPTNGANGALDYNGNAEVSGGIIIACGSSGMAQGFGSGSSQCSVLHDVSGTVAAGEEVTVSDSGGNVILSHTFPKEWQNIVFSSPELAEGETYTITAGSVSETAEAALSTSGSSGFGKWGR